MLEKILWLFLHCIFISVMKFLLIYITISTFTSVCPYGIVRRRRRRRPSRPVLSRPVPSHFRFLSCSEFQKPSQTAAERGEAELRILDFKTTWSEFQKQVWPLLGEAKPSCVYSILKPHGQSFRRPVRPLLSEAKPSYVYSILKPHGQSFRNPNCCSQQHSTTSPCGFRIK